MSEPDPPVPIETVRADLLDAGGVRVAFYSGPREALEANVPPGGSYVEVPLNTPREWPPTPDDLRLDLSPEEPPT